MWTNETFIQISLFNLRLFTKQPTRRAVTLRATVERQEAPGSGEGRGNDEFRSPLRTLALLVFFPCFMTLHEQGFDGGTVFARA